MADSAEVRVGIQAFLQRKASTHVKNTLWDAMPTFDMFFGLNGNKKDADGLGRVKSDHIGIGRINGVSRPMKEKMFREREYLPIIQITKPSKADAKKMGEYDNNPVVDGWDTTNRNFPRFVQPRFKFSRTKMPCVVSHYEMRIATANGTTEGQAAKAIGSVYEVEQKSRMAALCERLNDELWGNGAATGAPTSEDAKTWDSIHSIYNALGTTNTYGGIDRSLAANSWWRGNRHTTAFTGSFEDLINHSNYTLNGGLLKKGLGVGCIAVGGTLMVRAKKEAKAYGYVMQTGSVPDPEYGFKREVVCIYAGNRKVYIYYEPAIDELDTDAGTYHAYCLDPSTWTIAIPGDRNFKISTPVDATKVAEGGDEKDFFNIETEMLMCCEVPSGNAIYTNVSAA